MALPILPNWLSRKIRYSLMATIVFRFMIGSNVEQLKFDLSTLIIWVDSCRSIWLSLLKRTVQGQLEFKNPSLHVANLMHTLRTHSWIIFTQCTQLVSIFWIRMVGRAGTYQEICVPLASRSRTVHIYLQLFHSARVVLDFYPPWLHLWGKQPLHLHNS